MNFFNDRKLAHRLRNHQVSAKEKFFYLLGFIFLINISSFIESDSQNINHIEELVTLIVEIIGLIICYQTNCKGDSKEFIERYICLSFPIFIRMLSMIIIAFFAIMTLLVLINLFNHYDIDNFLSSNKYQMLEPILSVAFVTYFYIRMRKAIATAASGSDHLSTTL